MAPMDQQLSAMALPVLNCKVDGLLRQLNGWSRTRKRPSIPPTRQSKAWTTYVHELASKTLFPKTKSWYMGSNIPGKKVESLNYTGGVPKYDQEIKDVAATAYKGFLIS
jgi:hypothetical protein